MKNLLPIHRIRIPNGLAVAAALLLLASSVVGYESGLEINALAQGKTASTSAECSDNDAATAVAERTRRGLNLGLILFRR